MSASRCGEYSCFPRNPRAGQPGGFLLVERFVDLADRVLNGEVVLGRPCAQFPAFLRVMRSMAMNGVYALALMSAESFIRLFETNLIKRVAQKYYIHLCQDFSRSVSLVRSKTLGQLFVSFPNRERIDCYLRLLRTTSSTWLMWRAVTLSSTTSDTLRSEYWSTFFLDICIRVLSWIRVNALTSTRPRFFPFAILHLVCKGGQCPPCHKAVA